MMDSVHEFIEIAVNAEKEKAKHKLNRIAKELRTYYDDMMAAKEFKMTIELGEVLRDQMVDVFKILEENGIKMKDGE